MIIGRIGKLKIETGDGFGYGERKFGGSRNSFECMGRIGIGE